MNPKYTKHANQKKDAHPIERAGGQVRVRVEHAISGVKRSRIVKDVFRNTKDRFSDTVMVVACGLHNLRVRLRKRRLRM